MPFSNSGNGSVQVGARHIVGKCDCGTETQGKKLLTRASFSVHHNNSGMALQAFHEEES